MFNQIVRLFMKYFTICNNENMPNSIKIAKVVQQVLNKPLKDRKFRQIWVHWDYPKCKQLVTVQESRSIDEPIKGLIGHNNTSVICNPMVHQRPL